jgi:alpha-1,2-glucosyltransferase
MRPWAVATVVAAGSLLHALALEGTDPIEDEHFHAAQIRRMARGDFGLDPEVTTLPGYHVILAAAAGGTGLTSLAGLRAFSALIALGSVPIFHLARRWLGHPEDGLVSLQYFFLPVLFPFHGLVYTDGLAVALVLASLALALRGRAVCSAFAAAAAVLVRQTSVVWVPLAAALSVRRDGWGSRTRLGLAAHAATLAAFAVFVVANQGVAIGDREQHPFPVLESGNIWLFLALCFVCFLPLHVARAPDVLRSARDYRRLAAVLVALVVAGVSTFQSDHPYNVSPTYLRSQWLAFLTASQVHRLAAAAVMAWTALSLLSTPLAGGLGALFWVSTVLALAPAWLVEPRYSAVPMTLYLLLREPGPAWAERMTLVTHVTCCLFLTAGLSERVVP